MSKSAKKGFKTFFRRYWYWFVAIPVLIVVSFVWLYLIGVFETAGAVVLRTATPEDINMTVDSMYHLAVTSDSDEKPVYSSDNPAVAEVNQSGFIISHEEGTAVITASVRARKQNFVVNVSAYAVNWYLTTGDTFGDEEIFAAFPFSFKQLTENRMTRNEYVEPFIDPITARSCYRITDNIAEDASPVFISVYTYDEEDTSRMIRKGSITLWTVPTAEIKEQKTKAYTESLMAGTTVLSVPETQVDEELSFNCGDRVVFHPKFTEEGFVVFYVDGIKNLDFPYKMDQAGNFSIDAMMEEFYVIAIVANKEAYRYKCSAKPPESPISIPLGDEMLFTEYAAYMPSDIIYYASTSAKVDEIFDEEGELIGFKGLELTKEPIYINCSSYEQKYITFRLLVSVIKKIEEEPNE